MTIAHTPPSDPPPTDLTPIGWGEGEPIVGTPFRQLVTSDETDGRLVVLSATMPPGLHVEGHVHDGEDQLMVVVRGTVRARVGERQYLVGPGGVAFMPRGVSHELWNDSDDDVQTLELYTPGGFEEVLAAGGRAGPGAG
jgi:quercetin dioxygenase-like cupin family protein